MPRHSQSQWQGKGASWSWGTSNWTGWSEWQSSDWYNEDTGKSGKSWADSRQSRKGKKSVVEGNLKNSDTAGHAEHSVESKADLEEPTATWESCWVDVCHIRFSQEQIHPFFHKRGPIQDVLKDIDNVSTVPEDEAELESSLAPSVRLLPPFEPIRCIRGSEHHGDLISLDNRRLHALQLAAVERWPVRCLAQVQVAAELPSEVWQAEQHKLAAGGLGPLGKHEGKPAALMEHLCGDVSVLIASRGSAWESWNVANAILARCGTLEERTTLPERSSAEASSELDTEVRQTLGGTCESLLVDAWDVFRCEREAHAVVQDVSSIASHVELHKRLSSALEKLRQAAYLEPGVVVKRVGSIGDRDGYISVVAQAAALRRLLSR